MLSFPVMHTEVFVCGTLFNARDDWGSNILLSCQSLTNIILFLHLQISEGFHTNTWSLS